MNERKLQRRNEKPPDLKIAAPRPTQTEGARGRISMRAVLLMLICALCGGINSALIEANPPTKLEAFKATMVTDPKVSITFTGTVKSIELLGDRELKIIPVDIDPRFAVVVHIESVAPQAAPLKEGADEVFAIHSPARLFRAREKDVIGKKYRFKLTWEKVSNGPKFSQFTANQIEDDGVRRK